MGTPKKNEEIKLKELTTPTMVERMRLWEIGVGKGKNLDFKSLAEILEETKEILLPLISWLDKPLFSGGTFMGCFVPERFREKRGVNFFGSDFMDIWLERSGRWFVWLRVPKPAGNFFQEADSRQLAEIIFQESEDFLKKSLGDVRFLKDLDFFRNAALYYAVVPYLLSHFFEKATALLREREERLLKMKEHLSSLDVFAMALDPLESQRKCIPIKEYAIFSEHERGTSRCTGGYLCQEALKPFWEVLDKRQRSGYRQVVSEYYPKSLKDFFWRVCYFFEEIVGAKSRGHADANSLFGFSSGRLPFSEEELVVLKKLAEAIKT